MGKGGGSYFILKPEPDSTCDICRVPTKLGIRQSSNDQGLSLINVSVESVIVGVVKYSEQSVPLDVWVTCSNSDNL